MTIFNDVLIFYRIVTDSHQQWNHIKILITIRLQR